MESCGRFSVNPETGTEAAGRDGSRPTRSSAHDVLSLGLPPDSVQGIGVRSSLPARRHETLIADAARNGVRCDPPATFMEDDR